MILAKEGFNAGQGEVMGDEEVTYVKGLLDAFKWSRTWWFQHFAGGEGKGCSDEDYEIIKEFDKFSKEQIKKYTGW